MGCGSNSGHDGCSCGGGASAVALESNELGSAHGASHGTPHGDTGHDVARVNGVPLHPPGERPDEATLRQRACTELLRQQAQLCGHLNSQDRPTGDGVSSQAASDAIESLLDAELRVPVPDEAACRRHFQAHTGRHARGERVHARHILFAATPGVDVKALRGRAEAVLIEVRADPARFAARARELSNCPSGADGGTLGVLEREDCAPEFARELFGLSDVGVLPRLVHSRFGLHVVEVLAREPGVMPEFEQVRSAVALSLQQQAFATALRQYLRQLAGRASLQGVELDAADSPLVQ